eukprot:TRINITY_DN3108_c0_g4_i1.p1 TRINITY_DN3108_c0_g4~~TRINITY_DN3108_c0_g4_i1.p1  ORF type:complete len:552 (-),score=63.58 TRINITY_DN3108_c0_g4_i1:573-2228(-)
MFRLCTQCPADKQRPRTEQQQQRHQREVHDVKHLTCTTCSYRTNEPSKLAKHQAACSQRTVRRRQHDGANTKPCCQCACQIPHGAMTAHLEQHKAEADGHLTCPKCNTNIISTDAFQRHVPACMTVPTVTHCAKCNFSFLRSDGFSKSQDTINQHVHDCQRQSSTVRKPTRHEYFATLLADFAADTAVIGADHFRRAGTASDSELNVAAVRSYLQQCVSKVEALCGFDINPLTKCRQVRLVPGLSTTSGHIGYRKIKLLPPYTKYPSDLQELEALYNGGMIYVGHHELVKWTADDVSDEYFLRWLKGDTNLEVDHRCNLPSCSNLEHLCLCTSAENCARRCGSAGPVECITCRDMPLFCQLLHPSTEECIYAAQLDVCEVIANRRAKWEQVNRTNDLQSEEAEIATWGKMASEDIDYGLSQATHAELQHALQRSTGTRDARSRVHVRVGALNAVFQFARERIAARLHTAKWWLDATLRTIVPQLTASHLCHCDTCADPAHLVAEPMWYNIDRKMCALAHRRGYALECENCGTKIGFWCPHDPECIPHVHPM